ncbi:MAG: trehalase-like domain-containing protein, partial [Microvirga sp.]
MTEPGHDQPIEHYGVIGDLQSIALVGMNGSIDFLCWPRADSPTVFGALLDRRKGGRFQITPTFDDARQRQLYLPDTNVLLTRFLEQDGVAEISDFMWMRPDGSPGRTLVRRVKAVRGELGFRVCFDPRFDYARAGHTIETVEDGLVFVPEAGRGSALRLRSPDVALRIHEGCGVAEFRLEAGRSAAFVMEDAQGGDASPAASPDFVANAFKDTANFWTRWIGRSTYQGRWREMVHRSALALKLMTSHRFGSVLAAPTFGLPETLGGSRNWDYRYTWIRDASFTVYAFMRLGFLEEAQHFGRWASQRVMASDADHPLRIMYAIDGSEAKDEEELPHL